jgi:N-ethylmaleimide reductase
MMAEYYALRASTGLIISEATNISQEGVGYPLTPGIWNREQVEAWKPVNDQLHEADGRLICQLWHCGWHSHSSMQPGNRPPLAPSPIKDSGMVGTFSGPQPFETPREMTRDDIRRTIDDYAKATVNARIAGFDGVEIHAANGYLIMQFLMQGSNHRQDEYGGSFENRSRFLFRVLEAVIAAWDGDHVGIRLSPSYYKYGMYDPEAVALFEYVIERLNEYKLLYLHLTEPYFPVPAEHSHLLPEVAPHFRKIYKGTLLSCGNHTRASALDFLDNGYADMIVFGKPFISNPDLAEKLRDGVPLEPWDESTFYEGGRRGYLEDF